MVDRDDMRDMPPLDGTTLGPAVALTPEELAEIDRRVAANTEALKLPWLEREVHPE